MNQKASDPFESEPNNEQKRSTSMQVALWNVAKLMPRHARISLVGLCRKQIAGRKQTIGLRSKCSSQ